MAEVRKKVQNDKYNINSIKIKDKKDKKEKKDISKKNSEKSTDNVKKGLFTRFRIFCNGVVGEFHKVHWPTKENMVKYSMATIFFIIFFSCFFYLINVIFALIQSLLH